MYALFLIFVKWNFDAEAPDHAEQLESLHKNSGLAHREFMTV
jgi:hypothetical protein